MYWVISASTKSTIWQTSLYYLCICFIFSVFNAYLKQILLNLVFFFHLLCVKFQFLTSLKFKQAGTNTTFWAVLHSISILQLLFLSLPLNASLLSQQRVFISTHFQFFSIFSLPFLSLTFKNIRRVCGRCCRGKRAYTCKYARQQDMLLC